jgi:hypothetical protein
MTGVLTRAPASVAAVLRMCEQGRSALARAVLVVEAKHILDQVAILEHAIKVRDLGTEAAVSASLLRVRAERRVGELEAQREKAKPGPRRSVDSDDRSLTLAEVGLTKDESSKYQRLASVPERHFEQVLDDVTKQARESGTTVTRTAVMRAIDPHGERTPADVFHDGVAFKKACDTVVARLAAARDAIRFGQFPGRGEHADLVLAGTVQALREARTAITTIEQLLVTTYNEQRRQRG